MISIISPAKNMKLKSTNNSPSIGIPEIQITKPNFINKTNILHSNLKTYQPWELESLMKINERLAVQAFMDYQEWTDKRIGTAALLAYDGLVYKNIKADSYNWKDLQFANKNIRILSGFYGLLRPLDGIVPYRLEMGSKIKINGESLYTFWKEELYDELYHTDTIIVNLASEEYAKCVRKYLKGMDQFIDIVFLTMKNGKLKSLATWAKIARGQMVKFIIKEKIQSPEKLKEFDWSGYQFEPSLSNVNKYVFIL